jgi:endonuclease III
VPSRATSFGRNMCVWRSRRSRLCPAASDTAANRRDGR